MQVEKFFQDFQDHLAPRLDTYEQAIYLYLFRHTRFLGDEEAVIGFKSARRRMACGIGEKGKPMSEGTAYEKLRSLEEKGCVSILDSTRDGRKIRLHLPSEIPGIIEPEVPAVPPNIERKTSSISMRTGTGFSSASSIFASIAVANSTGTTTSSSTLFLGQRATIHIATSSRHVGSATIGKALPMLPTGFARYIATAFSGMSSSKSASRTLRGCVLANSNHPGRLANPRLQTGRAATASVGLIDLLRLPPCS